MSSLAMGPATKHYSVVTFFNSTGTCSTISISNPSSAANRRGWLVNKRIRRKFKSDKICAPSPISR